MNELASISYSFQHDGSVNNYHPRKYSANIIILLAVVVIGDLL